MVPKNSWDWVLRKQGFDGPENVIALSHGHMSDQVTMGSMFKLLLKSGGQTQKRLMYFKNLNLDRPT